MAMPIKNNSRNLPGTIFFAAYAGSSMNPTLREPEIIEVMPYDNHPSRVGDVIFFLPAEAAWPIVHRIVRVTRTGISTLGDNNTQEDTFLLQPRDIKGQVVAAWRGNKRRKIAGGIKGRLTGRWLHWRRIARYELSALLHPLYQTLSHWGLIARVLPVPFRPRVVVFHTRGLDQFQLFLGHRIIGQFDDQKQQWQIQRPYQLLVDGRKLPRQPAKEELNQRVLFEPQQIKSPVLVQGVRQELILADGSRWEISAGDGQAASIVSQLGCAMQLHMTPSAMEPFIHANLLQLLIQVDARASVANYFVPLASENDGVVVCVLNPSKPMGGPYVNLMRLSLIFARKAQACGGVLLHGALAERDGMGVILAGPGGVGKSTASNRLPSPWRSLCDDTTLVVRDPRGNYWAHPWPTWSRFVDGGMGGTWEVQNAVPIKGIFTLVQSVEERVERVGTGQAVSLLGESVEQVSMFMAAGLSKDKLHSLHMEQFNALCGLARVVPTHLLHISRTGTFWQLIEQNL
jgi:SynChlorMet cassette protein ScmC